MVHRLRLGLVLLNLVASLALALYLRIDLVTPATMSRALGHPAMDLHVTCALLGVLGPLLFIGLSRLTWPHRAPTSTLLLPLGVVSHTIVLVLIGIAHFTESIWILLAIPLSLLGVLCYALDPWLGARRDPRTSNTVGVIAFALSFVALLYAFLPASIAVIAQVSGIREMDFSHAEPLLTGPYALVLPTTLALVVDLARQRNKLPARILLTMLVALTVVAVLAIGDPTSHTQVALAHAAMGGPLLSLAAWYFLPTFDAGRGPWLLGACAVAFVAACTCDLLLGRAGLPRGYVEYDPYFQPLHIATTVAWFTFVACALATTAYVIRVQRREQTAETFA